MEAMAMEKALVTPKIGWAIEMMLGEKRLHCKPKQSLPLC